MIVKPGDDRESNFDDSDQLVFGVKDISHNEIDLMGPAEQDDHPSELLREKLSTFLRIQPVVCAPTNNLNPLLLLNHCFVTVHKLKHSITGLWFTCHVMCVHKVSLHQDDN